MDRRRNAGIGLLFLTGLAAWWIVGLFLGTWPGVLAFWIWLAAIFVVARPWRRSRLIPRTGKRVHATVEWWSDEEGWGALAATDETPGGIFVHFSAIEMDGYKSLRAGQEVDAAVEGPLGFDQDGYRYRATTVWPVT